MPEKPSTQSRPSIHGCSDGFSLVELLAALGLAVVILGAASTVVLTAQKILEQDRHRTLINQNLRIGMDFVGIDVRQAGERLPGDAPAIELVDGAAGAPDTLTISRNLIDYVLPLCKNITAGSSADSVFVGKKKVTGPVPAGCAPVPDSNGDGWPDNIEAWRAYRIASGGTGLAYVYNPVTGAGEFFVYDAEDNSTFHLHKANGGSWQNDYLMNEEPRIYLMSRRSFQVVDDVLQIVINDDTDNPIHLVNKIADFQVRAFFLDGSVQTSMAASADWTQLDFLEVTLTGRSQFAGRTIERTVVSMFFPRNILSN